MMATLVCQPILPWWLLLPACLAFSWFAWRSYRACTLSFGQRGVLWGLRVAGFLLLAWFVCQPSWRTVRTEYERPSVAIVMDISASMEDNPLGVVQTRAARAVDFAQSAELQKQLSAARILWFSMGQELRQEWNPEDGFHAPRTFLADQLTKLAARLRGEYLAGILFLSDGLDQSVQRFDASVLGAPVLIPELEDKGTVVRQDVTDFAVGALSYPRRVIAGWKTTIGVTIRRQKGESSSTFEVRLNQAGKNLQVQQVTFDARESLRRLSFEVTPEVPGQLVYEVAIAPESDADPGNNRRELLIDVTDSRERLLYLEGTPRWEFKFLKRSLLAEKNFQLSAYLKAGDGAFINFDEAGEGGKLPPLDANGLRPYRTIILGDLGADAVTAQEAEAIRLFVEKGGGLLLSVGTKALANGGIGTQAAIAGLLPAVSSAGSTMNEGRYAVDFTPEGRAMPVFASLAEAVRFPPLLSVWGPVKPGEYSTVCLATSDGTPVLLVRRYGQGRVALLLSDSLWRWQMGGEAGPAAKGLYGRFVTQLLHWLVPKQGEDSAHEELQVVVAESEVELGQQVVLGAIGGPPGANVTCKVTTPSGKSLVFPMTQARLGTEVGLFALQFGKRCEFVPEEAGTYRIEMVSADGTGRASTLLLARYPEHEKTGAPIDRVFLARLAKETGGRLILWSERFHSLADLKLEPRQYQTTIERPIWNQWPWLAALLCLFCLEWWLRRRWELV